MHRAAILDFDDVMNVPVNISNRELGNAYFPVQMKHIISLTHSSLLTSCHYIRF